MRIPREAWWLGGLIVLVLILLVVLRGPTSETRQTSYSDATTYSSREGGLRALYVTLQKLGYDARRLRAPFTTSTLPPEGVMIVAAPSIPATPQEFAALRAWVAKGNAVLLAGDFALPFTEPAFPTLSPLRETPLRYARPLQPSYIVRGVRRFAVRAVARLQPPATPASQEDDEDSERNSPFMSPIWEYPREWADALATAVPLLADKEGTVVSYARIGRGSVVALASPWSLSNRGIGRADNLIFALNVIGPPGPVYFDEYHHGYGENLWWTLASLPVKLAAAELLLALLVVMYSYSRRFGPVVPLDRGRRQRSEFLGTMTALLRKGQATRLALRTACDGASQRLRTELGLAPDAGAAEIEQAASRLRPQAADKLATALRQCRSALDGRETLTEARAVALVRQLDEAVHLVLRGA
jgi:hypothetical protein